MCMCEYGVCVVCVCVRCDVCDVCMCERCVCALCVCEVCEVSVACTRVSGGRVTCACACVVRVRCVCVEEMTDALETRLPAPRSSLGDWPARAWHRSALRGESLSPGFGAREDFGVIYMKTV